MRISILIFIYTIHFTYLKVCTKFHNPKSSSCWENCRKMSHVCYKGGTEGKIEKEGKMNLSIFIFIYTIHLAYLKVYTKFENTGSNRGWEIYERNYHWRERKIWTNKGTNKQYVAVFCCTIQLITIKLCTKFQNPNSSSSWEIFEGKKCPYVYKSDRRKNEKLKKEGKIKISIFIFIYTIHFAYLKVYTKFENTGPNRSWEICDSNFHWWERKTNK